MPYGPGSKKPVARRRSGDGATSQASSPGKRTPRQSVDTRGRPSHRQTNTDTDSDDSTSESASSDTSDDTETSEQLSVSEYNGTSRSSRFKTELAKQSTSRKRTLSNVTDTSDSLKRTPKKVNTRENTNPIIRSAKSLSRCISPFIDIKTTFLRGFELNQKVADDPERFSELDEKKKANVVAYRKIMQIVPDLENFAKQEAAKSSRALIDLADSLDTVSKQGRMNDCGSLRDNGLKYIPHDKYYSELIYGVKKKDRGFFCLTTACLLCPCHLRERFDENPTAFCEEVQGGAVRISHNDWPTFLYPEDGYNSEAIDYTLLQGPFLLACFRHIFTGPRTAMNLSPGTLPGKKSNARIHGITEVAPENIAYTAVMCRHVLNGQKTWSNTDGEFQAQTFYQNVIDLFDDKEWADETLSWWNKWVFDDDHDNDIANEKDENSGVAKLADQRIARRTQTSTHNDTHTRTEE